LLEGVALLVRKELQRPAGTMPGIQNRIQSRSFAPRHYFCLDTNQPSTVSERAPKTRIALADVWRTDARRILPCNREAAFSRLLDHIKFSDVEFQHVIPR
jgi:hypothetical protein